MQCKIGNKLDILSYCLRVLIWSPQVLQQLENLKKLEPKEQRMKARLTLSEDKI